ncbi:MAG: class I SAM-dependent methyltransferase [Nitrospira sp. CG24E]|nr:MAG: class I SAM-dependent methyltransferase [Nitrospira sp. CG24E]
MADFFNSLFRGDWIVRLFASFIIVLVRICEKMDGFLFRVQQLLTGILPALLPPHELTGMIRNHYDASYKDVATRLPETWYKWTLESWEEDVLARHTMTSGTILVLGAGVGRESIALAQRGFSVVGLDINRESLCIASQQATAKGLTSRFAQADFLALPVGPARVDYLFMSGIMYSSIPGRERRQAWLRSLRPCMSEQGLVVLNFLIARELGTKTHRLIHRLNRLLTMLPGANQSYQLGDTCSQNHFLHAFVDEHEIRSELHDTGASVDYLSWHEGHAVLTWSRNGADPLNQPGA